MIQGTVLSSGVSATPIANKCGMSCTKELSDFKHAVVIGLHLCHKSVCEISVLPDLPL